MAQKEIEGVIMLPMVMFKPIQYGVSTPCMLSLYKNFVINIQAYIVVFECTVVMFCLMLL